MISLNSTPVIDPAPDASLTYASPAGPLVVQSAADYETTAERLKVIKTFQQRVAQFFAPLKRKAQESHKALCDRERETLAPAVEDEQRIKRALAVYDTEQERLRRLEERRLQEIARQEDETRRLAEAAALEREAQATGDQSLRDAAQQIMDGPAPLATVDTSALAAPKVSGLSYRETYRAEVVDLRLLVLAIVSGNQPLALIVPNQSALDGMARSLKREMRIPGVTVRVEKTAVARTR